VARKAIFVLLGMTDLAGQFFDMQSVRFDRRGIGSDFRMTLQTGRARDNVEAGEYLPGIGMNFFCRMAALGLCVKLKIDTEFCLV
jgi:hypothetical protein